MRKVPHVGLSSGMLRIDLVEQPAWHEFSGDAEQSAEETADGSQATGELGVVGGVGILDAGIDDGAYAATNAGADKGSSDHRSGRVAGANQLDVSSGEGDRAIDSSLSPVTDQTVVVG